MTETAEQPMLLPVTPPKFTTLNVQLDDLPPDEAMEGPDPERDLIESIRTFGVINPLTLIPTDDGEKFRYYVLAGARRVKALRALHREYLATHPEESAPEYLTSVPARMPQVEEGDATDVLAIHTNATAKRNPVAEYQHIRRLLARGHGISQIAQKTGLTKAEVMRLLQLDELPIKLLEGARAGRVSMGQAYSIVKLPEAARERLEEKYTEKGKLSQSDIESERHIRLETASLALDWGVIGDMPASTSAPQPEPVSPAYVEDSVRLGRQVLDAIHTMRDMSERIARVLFAYDGQEFELVVQPITDQQGGYTPPRAGEPQFHPERIMLASDGEPAKIGCPICPAYPGEMCHMLTREQADQARLPTALLDSVELEQAVEGVLEAVASVALDHVPDAETIVIESSEEPAQPWSAAHFCQHGSDPETCDQQPCRRKRQQRDFARRKRAAARDEAGDA